MNPTNDNQTFETIMFDPKAKKADGRKRQVMDEPEDSTQPNTKKKSKNPKGEWTPARRLAVLKLYEDFRPLEIFHSVEVDFEELDQFQIKNLRDIYKNAEDDVKKALRAANDIRFDNEDYKEMLNRIQPPSTEKNLRRSFKTRPLLLFLNYADGSYKKSIYVMFKIHIYAIQKFIVLLWTVCDCICG
ncbi:hypothetical protein BDF21DRAFT_400164 [Thamnidium elegans]|nr:hypothetical protein BDF21DRAFT_400164 [Thamnidium elegans]